MRRKFARICVFIVLSVVLTACGGGGGNGDNGNGGSGTGIPAYAFDPDNMMAAASYGLDGLVVFARLNPMLHTIIEMLEGAPPTPPIDPGFCRGGGRADLTWQGDPLASGGRVTLAFQDCVLDDDPEQIDATLSGELVLEIVHYLPLAMAPQLFLRASMDMALIVAEELDGAPSGSDISLNCLLRFYRSADRRGILYGGRDADTGALLTIAGDAATIRLGCFDVKINNPMDGGEGDFDIGDNPSPLHGIVRIDNRYFTMARSRGGSPFDLRFEDFIPVDGFGVNFFGFADHCPVVAPEGFGSTRRATMSLSVQSPGLMRIDLFNQGDWGAGPDASQEIPWVR